MQYGLITRVSLFHSGFHDQASECLLPLEHILQRLATFHLFQIRIVQLVVLLLVQLQRVQDAIAFLLHLECLDLGLHLHGGVGVLIRRNTVQSMPQQKILLLESCIL